MLQVGDEYFDLQTREEGRSHLYVEEENDLLVYHKNLVKQLQVVPSSLRSKTHERLMNSQINKIRTHRTVMPITQEQALKHMKDTERDAEESRQRQAREKANMGQPKRRGMEADFLEMDEDMVQGPSLKQLKKGGGGSMRNEAFLQRAASTLR